MMKADHNTEGEMPIALFDASGTAITGALASSVTVKYKKYNDTSWSTKSMSGANWREAGSGLYYISFTAAETDTYGAFSYWVAHASGVGFNIVQIDDYATEAATLQAIYDRLGTKVNKLDIIDRERDLDNQLKSLARAYEQALDDITHLQNEVAALQARIIALP
jgi:hypothetical protein